MYAESSSWSPVFQWFYYIYVLCCNNETHGYVNTLRSILRLVRRLRPNKTRVKRSSFRDYVRLRSVSPCSSAWVHASAWRRGSDRNLGYKKRDNKRPPAERMHFTSRQLQQLASSNYGLRNRQQLLVCIPTLGASDSSGRPVEATHDMFS